MKELIITQNVRRRFKNAIMAAAAMGALLAGTPAAYAWDQQATGAQMDYSLSREVAGRATTIPAPSRRHPRYSAGPYNPNGPRLHLHRRCMVNMRRKPKRRPLAASFFEVSRLANKVLFRGDAVVGDPATLRRSGAAELGGHWISPSHRPDKQPDRPIAARGAVYSASAPVPQEDRRHSWLPMCASSIPRPSPSRPATPTWSRPAGRGAPSTWRASSGSTWRTSWWARPAISAPRPPRPSRTSRRRSPASAPS